MRYVALDLVCGGHPKGEEPILGRWWIESLHEQFDVKQVNEGTNAAVELQSLTQPNGSVRLRFKMRCPRCTNEPVFTAEKIDEALAAIYEKGAYAKVLRVRV